MRPPHRAATLALTAVFLAFVVFAPAAPAAPREGPPDPDAPELGLRERLDALFERVRQEQQEMRTLEAEFVQRKESEMLLEAEVARGVFSYRAPDRVRWEFHAPNPITVVIDERTMTTWYRDLERADVLSVGRYSDRVLEYLGASGTLETLLDYFRVEAAFPDEASEPYRLTLDPRYPRIARRIESMQVWIERERFLPVRLRYVEPGGDVTEYRFSDLRVNGEVPPERFELDLPADVVRRSGAPADAPSE